MLFALVGPVLVDSGSGSLDTFTVDRIELGRPESCETHASHR